MNANEQFIVKHYSEDERPTLKGHGFDGLVIGDDRQEAQDFVDYLNTMLRQQQAEIEELKDIVLRFVDLSWGDGFKKYLNEADSLEENKLRDNVFAILRKASEK